MLAKRRQNGNSHAQTDTPNVLDKLHVVIAKQKFMEVAISLTTGAQAEEYSEEVYLGCQAIMGEKLMTWTISRDD